MAHIIHQRHVKREVSLSQSEVRFIKSEKETQARLRRRVFQGQPTHLGELKHIHCGFSLLYYFFSLNTVARGCPGMKETQLNSIRSWLIHSDLMNKVYVTL